MNGILDILQENLSSRSVYTLRKFLGLPLGQIYPPGMVDRVGVVLKDHGWRRVGRERGVIRWHHEYFGKRTYDIHRAAAATLRALEMA